MTIRKRPSRIVSLSPTATETLFAIGAGAQVVAVDDQSDYPKQAPHTSLSGYTPNVEAIASYKPDLVVAASDPKDLVSALRTLGIPVILQDAPSTIPGAYGQIRQLGAATGHAGRARSLVARMKAQIGRIVAKRRPGAAGASVYHELDPTFFSATSKTFVGRVYALFGLKNIADAAPGGPATRSSRPSTSSRRAPTSSSSRTRSAAARHAATVAARPGWSGIKAVRSGSILRIDDSIASRWGPRLVNFVRAVGTALRRLERLRAAVPETAIEVQAALAPTESVRARGVSPALDRRGRWLSGRLARRRRARRPASTSGPATPLRSLLAHLGLGGSTLDQVSETILWQLRVPRVLLAALVGGMLAVAGATYQGVFHNPLADPYLLGVAAGAGPRRDACDRVPAATRSRGTSCSPLAAFVGGALAVVVTWAVGRSAGRERDATTFVLAGVVVASFFTAVQTFVQQQNSDTLQEVYSWILGALPSSGWSDVATPRPVRRSSRPRCIFAYRRVARRPQPRRHGGGEPRRGRSARPARCSSSPRRSGPPPRSR